MRRHAFATAILVSLIAAARVVGAERYALIVGNNQYPSFSRQQWLDGCVNDARLMRQYLVGHFGFQPPNVRVLVNEQATRARVMDSLENWLVADRKPGDVLLFYWSGHGKQIRDENGDEKDEDGLDEVLAPYDFKMTSPVTAENYISDDELNAISKRAGPGRTFIAIFDCCHSGTGLRAIGRPVKVKYLYYEKPAAATRGATMRDLFFEPYHVEPQSAGDEASAGYDSPLREDEPAAPDRGDVALIAASRPHELAAESEPVLVGGRQEVHGALTLELVRAFRGEADYDRDGQVTFSELESFLGKPIVQAGNTQHPVVEVAAALREKPLFQVRAASGASSPSTAILPAPALAGATGLLPLKVSVASYDTFPGLIEGLDRPATAEVQRGIEDLLANLERAEVIERVSLSDPYEELVLYGATREAAGRVYKLGVLDSTAHFCVRKDCGYVADLQKTLRGELNRAYTVMNLMRLRQPPGSRERLELSLLPAKRTRFRLGEEMGFRVRASRSGYLTIVNITADGQMLLIYPNELIVSGADPRKRQGFVEGGQEIALPQDDARGTYKITEPVGDEFIKAFLTDRPTGMFEGAARPDGYARTTAGVAATGSIFRGLTRGLGKRPGVPDPGTAPAILPKMKASDVDFKALANYTWAEASLSFVTTY